jgi:nucleotide-binding universal stress UspA family protein/uncharacterized protein (DUF2062 family)
MKRWFPTRERLLQSRWLRPIAHRLHDEHLWHADRSSVARGVAIGLFFGLLLPVAQFLFAVLTAIALRGNVAIAAGSTLITNPLTFAPIYWLAHRVGSWLIGGRIDEAAAQRLEAQAEAIAAEQGFLESMWYSVQSAGAPLALGLAVLAVAASLVGFGLAWVLWRPRRQVPHRIPEPVAVDPVPRRAPPQEAGMFKHLLIATDGSELSLGAVRPAFELAKALGARVSGVYVIEPYPYTGIGQAVPTDRQGHLNAERQIAESAFAAMQDAAQRHGVPMEAVMAEDREAAQGIVDTAASRDADLIVMASHGRSGVAKLVLGSVAAKVLALSRAPVLVVK